MKASEQDTKKVFKKLGTCSRTFCFLLNREFGCPMEAEERAADPLAGGIMLRGHQCGMLWGSSLAVGAESCRRNRDNDRAVAAAITATKGIVESYSKRTGSANCRDVTGCDFTNRAEMLLYMAKFILNIDRSCFDLAEEWLPEAIQSAFEGLSREQKYSQKPISCASEVAKKMGASEKEMAMVAGFAGGLGLSGLGCGALSAAVWMKSLAWCRNNPGKSAYKNPEAKKMLKAFFSANGSEMLCHQISGQRFQTIDDHTAFIKNGGCGKLINALAQS